MSALHQKNLEQVDINGETFFKITDVDSMRPFFISVVSDSNHWMFVSSNGGISCGRKNSQYALFPYYTDDKITESTEITGSKSIFRITKNGSTSIWEPFSIRGEGKYKCTRNLYQNNWANKIIFEEINHDLKLTYQYEWNSSNKYGFVKHSKITNESQESVTIDLIDGLQNIMPYGVPSDLQNSLSNLVDAYKRAELVDENGMGIFALSAIIVDKAEPSEALKANIVWSLGLSKATYLLSAVQLKNFRNNHPIVQETDSKGEKGAYFISTTIALVPQSAKEWAFVANVNQSQSAIVALAQEIKNNNKLLASIIDDINAGTQHLLELIGAADGVQCTADSLKDTRHYSNVLFNIMRGGIFDHNYQIEKQDFETYLQKANKEVAALAHTTLQKLDNVFNLFDLQAIAAEFNNKDFNRLSKEYLPLKFSRRHGDPSRPWNQFSINTRNEVDGSKILDYQGNWRDIFQNWEALAHSYPFFIEGMISKFLNASTFDGYNPYRVTKDGFDWETIEPDNPWAYIGYWGDHQIIYLLKFLEFAEQQKAGSIAALLPKEDFVYANVPYRVKSYESLVENPKDTIIFDHHNDLEIRLQINETGADGALLTTKAGNIHTVNFVEKILATVLSKLSNFIPEAGIWMNTQRPEWNDANNALVGNGVSMVTLCYLRRFISFLQQHLQSSPFEQFNISEELFLFFSELHETLASQVALLSASIDNSNRKKIVDALGQAGSKFRATVYENKFSGKKTMVSLTELQDFTTTVLQFIEHSIKANKRKDGLYHAYNLLQFNNEDLSISHLSEMLEGQVAVLSSQLLSPAEIVEVLNALRKSSLYRQDQDSYILYPNKSLPGFLERNNVPATLVESSALIKKLLADNNKAIIEKDVNGTYHFNGNFKNGNDVTEALRALPSTYQNLVTKETSSILAMFEKVFNHKEFTGRSGTFYGYEGLGSIYWHMVSKLALAAQESVLNAIETKADANIVSQLTKHYYHINEGIGIHKSPVVYGAFPTTPYSHTPLHRGAQQPGMTGQVKEDIICRMGEMGAHVKNGRLLFNPTLLQKSDFLQLPKLVEFVDVLLQKQKIQITESSLLFTFCQIPIIYRISDIEGVEIENTDGSKCHYPDLMLNETETNEITKRTGRIAKLIVSIKVEKLTG